MNKNLFYSVAAFFFFAAFVFLLPEIPSSKSNKTNNEDKLIKKHLPSEHFFLQRSYPEMTFDLKAYETVLKQENNRIKNSRSSNGFDVSWKLEGPQNIGGRINTIAVHPQNQDIIYVGNASGGIFKTTNGGNSWMPVFDDQPFLSIGYIAIDPLDPDVVYAGTGDPNISGYPFIGDGIWKSTDAGNNWVHLGLTDQRVISRIVIDPSNTNTIYVATMGLPFERNNSRGLYKSTNGGISWQQILYINDDAGIIDLVIDPVDPNTLYAAGWNRIRNNSESIVSGPAAKIYKTTDGGDNWTILNNGLPSGDHSRIGLAISTINPNTVFAVYVDAVSYDFTGIYKTTNGGTNWSAVPTSTLPSNIFGGFGWYFGQIRVNPVNDDELFVLGVDLYKTEDGGNNWEMAGPPWWDYMVHADKHDLVYLNSNSILLSTDGGIYKSTDGGDDFSRIDNIPNTQFYRVGINPHNPSMYYGGAQDQGTMGGNAANINNWERIFGGDGFQIIFDPEDPDLIYVETQNGGLYYLSGTSWDYFDNGIDNSDRRSWDMPIIMNPLNNFELYTGTYRMYRINDAPNGSWYPISGDLTKGVITQARNHVISTVHQSAVNQDYLYAGTSDGRVWRSLDKGNNWSSITGTLPDRYVTRIVASPDVSENVYVTHSGYRDNEFIPHLHKSIDNGNTWTDISGALPQFAINDVFLIPGQDDKVIFVATDGGIYGSIDAGNNWERVGGNMPVIPVYDIDYNPETKKLVAGTFARSLMTFPVDSILKDISVKSVFNSEKFTLFPSLATQEIKVNFDRMPEAKILNIFSVTGSLVKQVDLKSNRPININISDLVPGIYIVAVSDGKNKLTSRFIKAE